MIMTGRIGEVGHAGMVVSHEYRRQRRFTLCLQTKVAYGRNKQYRIQARTVNISSGGALLELESPTLFQLPLDTNLQLKLEWPAVFKGEALLRLGVRARALRRYHSNSKTLVAVKFCSKAEFFVVGRAVAFEN